MKTDQKRQLDFVNIIFGVTALAWLVVQLYFSLLTPIHPLLLGPIFLAFALVLVFIDKPMGKAPWLRIIDVVFIGLVIGVVCYDFLNAERIITRIPNIDPVLTGDFIATWVMLLLLLEAVRRVLGNSMVIFIAVFILYALFGPYMPGFTRFTGLSWQEFAEVMTMTNEGIYGTPLGATLNFIFYFILFGVVFSVCGGGQVLVDLGMKLGKSDDSGPARAAVVSSALLGMVSGSSVANVTTSGVMTIPMMKKVGYTPEQAGAIEAVASTGSQIMPPIMGVGAFIMAELLGIRYSEIVLAAIIPAVAYFASVYFLIGFVAKKNNYNRRVDKVELESIDLRIDPILPRLYLLAPAVMLIVMVLLGDSLRSSAIYSTLAILVLNVVVPGNRRSLREIYVAFIDGIRQAAAITLPIAACGIIIAIVIHSGLTNKFATLVTLASADSLLGSLLLTAAGVMLLGMALPTVAAYLIGVVLFVPAMLAIGIPIFIAHMFCFYFGVIAQITPPVCLASFTAAGIAGGDMWKTGWTGFIYASVSFLVPFVFVYQPAILLIGSPTEIVTSTFFLFAGVYALAIAIGGALFVPISGFERAGILAVAILLIVPETLTSLIGLAALASFVAWKYSSERRRLRPI